MHGAESDEDEEEVEAGKRELRKLHDPLKPSQKEIREHQESGHMPFRSWCPHCVRGRGKEMQHRRKRDEEESGIPEYHLDYCFPGDEGEDRLTILVIIERRTKTKKVVVAPSERFDRELRDEQGHGPD